MVLFSQIVSSAALLEMVLLHESHLELAILLLELSSHFRFEPCLVLVIFDLKGYASSCSFLSCSIVLCWACSCMSAKDNKNWEDPVPFLFSLNSRNQYLNSFLLRFRWWNHELFLILLRSSSSDPLPTLPFASRLGHGAIWDLGIPLFFCGLSGSTRTWCHHRVFNCSCSHWRVIL